MWDLTIRLKRILSMSEHMSEHRSASAIGNRARQSNRILQTLSIEEANAI